ncbi:calcium-binding protein [Salipiger sp. HF18]|uniref:calcium-binding protein n=1 Tax=Salipiger sp. HF18 TaxID=2721557 RepID=UPI00142E7965|nr:calcium-binding protein [Salipiger sp. HF18]NIY97933.1 calcium-binding protein [Salipiger sp. HF18]
MPGIDLEYVSSSGTGQYVSDDHFGANALHNINISDDGADYKPSQGFHDAIHNHNITNLRYPGGHVENTLDVTNMRGGHLRPEVAAFLDWCLENSSADQSYKVTFVLPTKSEIPLSQIEEFVHALLSQYGDLIVAFEVGNEYSIGTRVVEADRSVHPEYIEGSDFVSAMNEVEYGVAANRVINATQNALDRLATTIAGSAPDPKILLQMAETSGAGSSYKGGDEAGNFDAANEEILSMLSPQALDAVDGAVVHYYYNVSRDEGLRFTDAEDWREVRRIDERFANFQEQLGRDVELFITEWNVVAGNDTQHGAASASVLMEMFEFMVRMGVDDAHIWPLQHRTPNNIMGNRNAEEIEYTMSGAAFSMLSESLRPRDSDTGQVDAFQSVLSDWSGGDGSVEVNHFTSGYQEVLFISLRSNSPSGIGLDLGNLVDNDSVLTIDRLTVDPTSSDGLSDFANSDGGGRVGRRPITAEELAQLETLAFFDADNPNHVRYSGDQILTYLPPFDTIIPLIAQPTSIDDYYLTSEIDVEPLIQPIEAADGDATLSFDLMPYDVVRIVIDNPARQDGTDGSEELIGGVGRDVLLGRGGDDYLNGGEDEDMLKGGWGNDTLRAGDGDDELIDGLGDDVLYGEAGVDTLQSSGGTDALFGGTGDDWLDLSTTETFSDGYSAHHVHSGRDGLAVWKVSLDGFNRYNAVTYGGDEFDTISLSGGNDAYFLDDVYSAFNSAAGSEPVSRVNDVERIFAGAGDDILDMTSTRFSNGGSGLELHGQDGDDTLWGTTADDSLFGGDGNDVLEGGGGNDILMGGSGADEFHLLSSGDTLQEIIDFNTVEGDTIVLHLSAAVSASALSMQVDGDLLRLMAPDGSELLVVDVGDAAADLATAPLTGLVWLDFV